VLDLTVDGRDWPDLMANWLRELLYLVNAKALVVRRVDITQIQPYRLSARIFAEAFDPRRHVIGKEIKAVTFHQLAVQPDRNGWRARIVLDT